MTDLLVPSSTASRLEIVARELGDLSARLEEAAAIARSLADATEWRARAAETFHALATHWAGDVSGMVCLAETARLATVRARDAAIWQRETER